MSITRRSFITNTAAFAGLTTFPLGHTLAKTVPPSEQIRVAGIGLGPRGRKLLQSFLSQPDVKFVAIADEGFLSVVVELKSDGGVSFLLGSFDYVHQADAIDGAFVVDLIA